MRSLSDCRDCKRLGAHLEKLRLEYPHYHNGPVAAAGDENARLLVVGLAPGKHGANATGFPFTGDASGDLLYKTLHALAFSSHAVSSPDDPGFRLNNCRITNAVKCLPPDNRPTGK